MKDAVQFHDDDTGTTNLVEALHTHGSEERWLELAAQVRTYPFARFMLAVSFASPLLSKVSHRNIITSQTLTSATNGGDSYEHSRQDIYIPAVSGDAQMIKVAGNITSANGSIWVWAEQNDTTAKQHYKFEQQFAVIKDGVTDVTGLTAFRDAQDDDTAANSRSDYLTGVLHDGDTTNVYWGYAVSGFRKVILRKVASADYQPIPGAVFFIYSHVNNADPTKNVIAKDKTGAPTSGASGLTSLSSGVYYIGELPYGTYYLHETTVPNGYSKFTSNDNWFILTVNENGVGYKNADDTVTKEIRAETAAP